VITFEHTSGKLGTSFVDNFSTPALGRSVALLGTANDGVTAALALAGGALRAKQGTVRVFGEDPTLAAARGSLAYVPLAHTLPSDLTVAELLTLASISRDDAVHTRESASARLDQFGAAALARRRIGALSAAEVRTVLLVEAFTSPGVRALVIDEPRVEVSPEVARVLVPRFGELVGSGGTVLIGTSSARDAVELVDAVAVVRGGRFFTSVRSNELLLSPPGSECYVRVLAADGGKLVSALSQRLDERNVALTNGTIVIRGSEPLAIADAIAGACLETNVDILELRHVLPTIPGAGGASPP